MRKFRLFAASAILMTVLASAVQAQPPDLQGLHDALSLTPAQEEAWRAFAATSSPDPQQTARDRMAAAMMPNLSAPQRVDLSIAAMQADLHTLEQRGTALKAFYATLTPAQQTAFDRKTAPSEEGQLAPTDRRNGSEHGP